MAKLAIFLACLVGVAIALPTDSGVISASLMKKLKTKQVADITIDMKEGVSQAYFAIQGRNFPIRGQKMASLRSALISNAQQSQKSLQHILANKSVQYRSHWINNKLTIRNADLALVEQIAQVKNVAEVREMIVVPVEEPTVATIQPQQGQVQWGVRKIKADLLWDGGNNGTGIIVANVDTGVRGTHRILSPNFLGQYGWFSPSDMAANPVDRNGHGTHTMGTIAGQEGYGVAPGARWQACMGCAGSSCWEDDLLDCGQWIACPTLADGTGADCSKAPHLVSNSWGSTIGADSWYDGVIAAWHAAKVLPIFSAGNAGTACGTTGSPGDRDVIGVGATGEDDSIAYFSSVGPSWDGKQKPEIAAPGYLVNSAYNGGDNDFAVLSGTSMACPHVAGAVALLLKEKPNLVGDYEGVRAALFSGAQKTGLTGTGNSCDGVSEDTFPNYTFGHGRLDIAASSMGKNATVPTIWF